MFKSFITCLLAAATFAASAGAYQEPSFEAFFADKTNAEQYEKLAATGALKASREQYTKACGIQDKKKAKATGDTAKLAVIDKECDCASKEIAKLDDKKFFYVSVTAYQRFNAKVAASRAGDKAELERLRTEFKKKPSELDAIGEKCKAAN